METNLRKIKDACVLANPEIEKEETIVCNRDWSAWEVGTMTSDDFEIYVGRPIRLADVLLAIPKNDLEIYASANFLYMRYVNNKEKAGTWILSMDNLEHQSEETLAFLANLL